MLKPENKPSKQYSKMDAAQRKAYDQVLADEEAARADNEAAAKPVAERLRHERGLIAMLVAELKAARVEAGVSLSELEKRTGIRKSALSRLENAKAPNPTLATLLRYAAAIDHRLSCQIEACD